MESDIKELPFLDILIKNIEGHIETDIYSKPTDAKQYLLFSSAHPKHTKTNLPFSLARRTCAIVSEKHILNQRLSELEQTLRKRNYPINIIKNGIEKAKALQKETLRIPKQKTDDKSIPYISTHNKRNPEIFNIIRYNTPILHQSKTMDTILKTTNFLKSKRQPNNLKQLLTKAEFNETQTTPSITRCNRPNCKLCLYLEEGNEVKFKNGKKYTIKFNMDCNIKNVIYRIKCKGCGEDYIH